jgi:uncharacterized membrane protein
MTLERLLASVLRYGTWIATAVIALGLLGAGTRTATVGIALLILLPVLRLIVMLIVFLRHRDYALSAIAGLVLAFIALGFKMG